MSGKGLGNSRLGHGKRRRAFYPRGSSPPDRIAAERWDGPTHGRPGSGSTRPIGRSRLPSQHYRRVLALRPLALRAAAVIANVCAWAPPVRAHRSFR